MSRYRNICFTLNNYTEEEYNVITTHEWFTYIVVGREVGEAGTPHLQGYAELNGQKSLRQLQALNQRWHIERRRGTPQQASDYCKKDGDFFESGEMRQSGRRNDLTAIRTMIANKEPYIEIINSCNNYQQTKMADLLLGLQPISHNFEPREVHYFYGPTGTGKTRTAMEACPAEDTWHANITSSWFDGYWGQGHVIIDEFRAKNWPYDLMLRILDGYDLRLPKKGGFVIWQPRIIYITAPLSPERIYAGQLEYHGSVEQLLRRITHLRNFEDEPYEQGE